MKIKPLVYLSLFLLLITGSSALVAQELELFTAYRLFEEQYPNLKNGPLYREMLGKELEILLLERRPTLEWKATASLQSETVGFSGGESLPLDIDLPLYSARAYGEINYLIKDGGYQAAQTKIKKANAKVSEQEVVVEQYALRERINELFLGINLNRERLLLYAATLEDLATRQEVLAAGVEYGAVLESELLQLRVSRVEISAERDNLIAVNRQLFAQLSALVGQSISPSTVLVFPPLPDPRMLPELDRPELRLLDYRKEALLAQSDLVEVARKPQLSAYAQLGVGFPNPLNLFDNSVAPFAIGGLNFRMPITDWNKSKREKELLRLHAQQLDHQRQTLAFNYEAGNEAYLEELNRLEEQLSSGQEVLRLQERIQQQMAAQLDNGVITAADYLVQANATLRARQQLEVFRTEKRKKQIEFLNRRGGLSQ